jgi:hypothetical protein
MSDRAVRAVESYRRIATFCYASSGSTSHNSVVLNASIEFECSERKVETALAVFSSSATLTAIWPSTSDTSQAVTSLQ